MRIHLIVAAALLSATLAAHADSISFTEYDVVAGLQTGSVANTTGSADILYFGMAVFHSFLTIDLTNSSGIVTDTIFNAPGITDYFEFAGIDSGVAAIGTSCVASSTVACVLNTGGTINLTSTVNDLDGDAGYFGILSVGYSAPGSLTVTADDSPLAVTPEPSSFLLLGTGLLAIAGVLRKRLA